MRRNMPQDFASSPRERSSMRAMGGKMRLRIALVLAILTLGSATIWAFGRGGQQDPEGRLALSYSLAPTPEVTVTNKYSSRLTGMVIAVFNSMHTDRPTEIIWFDSGVNFRHDSPLEIGASRSFRVGPVQQASTLQPKLMAAAFENGISEGDSAWLSTLHARRQAAYDEIVAVTKLLDRARTEGQTNQQTISVLKGMNTSLRTSIPEVRVRTAAGLVIHTTITNLERANTQDTDGNPQKTITGIISLFGEWRGALRRFDKISVESQASMPN